MKITCTKCATIYNVPAASIGQQGRKVKCIRCANIWIAQMPVVSDKPKKAAAQKNLPMKWFAPVFSLLALSYMAMLLLIFNHQIMHWVPMTEIAYEYMGLTSGENMVLDHVVIDDLTQAGTHTTELWLQGDIVNNGEVEHQTPGLKITLLDKEGQSLVSETMQLRHAMLKPGQRFPINNKLLYAYPNVASVELSLGNRVEQWKRSH